MRLAFLSMLIGIVGITVIQGWSAASSISGYLPQSLIGTYGYSTIPLFIIMGYFAYSGGLTQGAYRSARAWLGHLPGGLAIATVWASAGFAACSGASTAAAAILSKVSVPEMRSAGYDTKLSVGIVSMGGCLASLIPPSVAMVVYGILTETSIAAVLMAGFLPGILTTIAYSILIYIRVRLNPRLGPPFPAVSWKARFASLKECTGMLLLALAIIGGMYSGIFTPTEAGGIGAFIAFLSAVVLRRLNWINLKEALIESMRSTVMIFAIMLGISIFIRFLALSGVTEALGKFAISLPVPRVVILICILFIYVLLGMFMDAISMMMLSLPIFFPPIVALGYNPIWFGVIVIVMCEVCLVTPPVGLVCFVVHGVVSDVPLSDVFMGVMPFLAVEFVVLALLIAFPEIVLIVPHMMGIK